MNDSKMKFLTLLMNAVENLCKDEGIEYFAQFQLGNNEIYHHTSGHVLLDTATILNQLQLLEARKGIKF